MDYILIKQFPLSGRRVPKKNKVFSRGEDKVLEGGLIQLKKNEKQLLKSKIRLIQIRNKASILKSEAGKR